MNRPIPLLPLLRLRPRDYRGVALPIALIALWYGVSTFGLVNAHILPPPHEVWLEGYKQLISGSFALDLLSSLSRDAAGLAVGGLLGLLLGIVLGVSRRCERLIAPTFNALKQIAIFAWIPLISAWFGTGESAKVVFVALAAFFPMVINVFEGVRSVSRDYVEVARAFEFGPWQLLRKVVLPAASPQILTGLQLALIYAWLATLGAEYFMKSSYGVGNSMIDGREHFNMGSVLFGVIVVGVIGAVIDRFSTRLERWLMHWRDCRA